VDRTLPACALRCDRRATDVARTAMSVPVVLGVSGSVTQPSRTTVLIAAVLAHLASRGGSETRLIELAEEAAHLFAALTPSRLDGRAREIVRAVEDADLLVVGSPVYRASYTGALKHLFDLVDHRRFIGKPVVLVATGGSQLHGLVPEHQLRPLFGFLNALTLPTTIYAVESDFVDYAISSATIRERIERVVEEALEQLGRRGGKSVGVADRRLVFRA
jgi:FMN reductase